jgi:hypothetical protein
MLLPTEHFPAPTHATTDTTQWNGTAVLTLTSSGWNTSCWKLGTDSYNEEGLHRLLRKIPHTSVAFRLMRPPFCLTVYPSVYVCVSPLILVRRLMRSPCCLRVIPLLIFIFLCCPRHMEEAYMITLLSVYPFNFLVFYSVRVVSKGSSRLVPPRTSCLSTMFLFVS